MMQRHLQLSCGGMKAGAEAEDIKKMQCRIAPLDTVAACAVLLRLWQNYFTRYE